MFDGLGSIIGGIGSLFSQNPSDAAAPYLNQIPGQLQGIYGPWMGQNVINSVNPYLQGGQWAQGQFQNQIGNLMNNPTALMNQWGSSYQSSPGYKWQVGQATNAANNAGAAAGMAGSPAEQQQLAGTVNQLANQDYWQYLNNAQGLYGLGFGGLQNMFGTGAQTANNIYGIGANMANEYGTNLSQAMMNQGINAYNGAINQNQSMLGGLGSIASGIGSLLGF